jgi:hypothetical protein
MEQTKLMSESGSNPAKLAAYRATVKTQEEVLSQTGPMEMSCAEIEANHG